MNNFKPYSYKDDPGIPEFDDSRPVIVFDGVCVLCSKGIVELIKWDKKDLFRLTTAQSELGQALFQHYGCDTVDFDTLLLIHEGNAYIKSDAYFEACKILGGGWNVLRIFGIVPRFIRDAVYDFKASRRYKWFGKTEYCGLIPEHIKKRFI